MRDAGVADLLQPREGGRFVAAEDRLVDLDLDAARRDLVALQRLEDEGLDAVALQLRRGEVDGDAPVGRDQRAVARRLADDPFADRHDQARSPRRSIRTPRPGPGPCPAAASAASPRSRASRRSRARSAADRGAESGRSPARAGARPRACAGWRDPPPSSDRRTARCGAPRSWRDRARSRRCASARRCRRRCRARPPARSSSRSAISWPSTRNGLERRFSTRSASGASIAGSVTFGTTMANSSPESRASRSPPRSDAFSRLAQAFSSPSPTGWPSVSLTALKPSRSSTKSAALWPSCSTVGERLGHELLELLAVRQAGQLVVQGEEADRGVLRRELALAIAEAGHEGDEGDDRDAAAEQHLAGERGDQLGGGARLVDAHREAGAAAFSGGRITQLWNGARPSQLTESSV